MESSQKSFNDKRTVLISLLAGSILLALSLFLPYAHSSQTVIYSYNDLLSFSFFLFAVILGFASVFLYERAESKGNYSLVKTLTLLAIVFSFFFYYFIYNFAVVKYGILDYTANDGFYSLILGNALIFIGRLKS